jgi:hypothetical protein
MLEMRYPLRARSVAPKTNNEVISTKMKLSLFAIIGFAALATLPAAAQTKTNKPAAKPQKSNSKPQAPAKTKPAAPKPVAPKPAPTPAPTPAPAKELGEREKAVLGKYTVAGQPNVIDLVNDGGSLTMQATGYPAIPVELKEDDSLYNPILAGQVDAKIVRDADKKPNGIDLTFQGNKVQFQKDGATPLTAAAKPVEKPAEKPAEKPVEKPAEKPAETKKLPDILGKYAVDMQGPVGDGEIKYDNGKFILSIENQPDYEIEVTEKDEIKGKTLPEGVTAKLVKDKEGKVTGISAESPLGTMTWTRKTFVKLPEAPKPAAGASEKLKGAEGSYVTDFAGAPEIKLTVKDGKLVLQAEGQPELTVEVNDKDEFVSEQLKEMSFALKFTRDKDGKIEGISATTPFGEINFKKK